MDKHDFKVGDKVKLTPFYAKQFPSVGAQTLTIIKADCGDKYIPVWHKDMQWSYFPVKSCEIEHVVKAGQQLLFSFMEGE